MKKNFFLISILCIIFFTGCIGSGIFWSPDSSYFITCINEKEYKGIIRAYRDTAKIENVVLANYPVEDSYISCNQDLSCLAATVGEDGNTSTVIFRKTEDIKYREVARFPHVLLHPIGRWSPSGQKIILFKETEDNNNTLLIYKYNNETKSLDKITSFGINEDNIYQYFWRTEKEIIFIRQEKQLPPVQEPENKDYAVCYVINVDEKTSRTLVKNMNIKESFMGFNCGDTNPEKNEIIIAEADYLRIISMDSGNSKKVYPLQEISDSANGKYDAIFSIMREPTTGYIYFSASNSDGGGNNLFVYNPVKNDTIQLTYFAGDALVHSPSVSPDGRNIACKVLSGETESIMLFENNEFKRLYTFTDKGRLNYKNKMIESKEKYEEIIRNSQKGISWYDSVMNKIATQEQK